MIFRINQFHRWLFLNSIFRFTWIKIRIRISRVSLQQEGRSLGSGQSGVQDVERCSTTLWINILSGKQVWINLKLSSDLFTHKTQRSLTILFLESLLLFFILSTRLFTYFFDKSYFLYSSRTKRIALENQRQNFRDHSAMREGGNDVWRFANDILSESLWEINLMHLENITEFL